MQRGSQLIFSLAAATLIATAMLSVWLTSRLLAPLDHVSAIAGEITAGAFDRCKGLQGNDQIANLASAFDRMVDRLQEQIAREREAEARTRRVLADASHELRDRIAVAEMLTQASRSAAKNTSRPFVRIAQVATPLFVMGDRGRPGARHRERA